MADEVIVAREMACTREEFLAWLPAAAGGAAIDVTGGRIRIGADSGEVWIEIAQLEPRHLGALRLPVLSVRIRFGSLDERARSGFLQRFDLYTGRGGG